MRISAAYTLYRTRGAAVRLRSRKFNFDAEIRADSAGVPFTVFIQRDGAEMPAGELDGVIASAVFQSEDWQEEKKKQEDK